MRAISSASSEVAVIETPDTSVTSSVGAGTRVRGIVPVERLGDDELALLAHRTVAATAAIACPALGMITDEVEAGARGPAMSDREDAVTRRALVAGIAATAGVALVPATGGAAAQAPPGSGEQLAARRLAEQIPTLSSTALDFTNVPAIGFRPETSAAEWTATGGTLVSTTPAMFIAALTPSVNDWFRELDVYVNSGGQSGAIKLTRYLPLSPAAAQDLVSSVYPAATGLQNVVFHLDHRADPMFWNYVVSIELKPGVVLHGANLWYRPLGAGFVQLTPTRIYDSRISDGKLESGGVRTIGAPSLMHVSGSALINLTIDQTEVSGYLTAWAPVGENGSPAPDTSNINWTTDNQTLANLVVVKLGGEHGDAFNIRADGNGRTHVIVDLLGYFT